MPRLSAKAGLRKGVCEICSHSGLVISVNNFPNKHRWLCDICREYYLEERRDRRLDGRRRVLGRV